MVPFRPEAGCLQYHRTLTGRITTFNFEDGRTTHLADQDYSICLKRFQGRFGYKSGQYCDQTIDVL